MDQGLLAGLAEGLRSGLQTYRDETDKQYKRNLELKKMQDEDEERSERLALMKVQREVETARSGYKRDDQGNLVVDPESLAYKKMQADEEKQNMLMRAMMTKEQQAEYDRLLREKRLQADIAKQGLIEKQGGGYELSPEAKQEKAILQKQKLASQGLKLDESGNIVIDLESPIVKEKLARVGLLGAQTKTEEQKPGLIGAQIQKAQAQAKKAIAPKAAEASQYIPGYQWDQRTIINKSEIPKLQQAVSDKNTLEQLLQRVKNTISSSSPIELSNPYSKASKQLTADLRDAQLLYKGDAFAKLGVLTGPDLSLLEQVVERPGITNLAFGGGKEALIERYNQAINRINSRLESTLATRGLRKSGGQGLLQTPTQMQPSAPLEIGTIKKGYRYKGGDPSQQSSWEKVK